MLIEVTDEEVEVIKGVLDRHRAKQEAVRDPKLELELMLNEYERRSLNRINYTAIRFERKEMAFKHKTDLVYFDWENIGFPSKYFSQIANLRYSILRSHYEIVKSFEAVNLDSFRL